MSPMSSRNWLARRIWSARSVVRPGEIFARQLAETPIAMTGVESARPTRRTVTIVEDDGTATALNEDGEEWAAADWPLMRAAFDDLLRRSEPGVVVLTGSVPPGTPATAYADCVAAAHDRGFTTIVDCSGPHLIAAIEAGAHVVKPKRHELLATVDAEGMKGVRRLREQPPPDDCRCLGRTRRPAV